MMISHRYPFPSLVRQPYFVNPKNKSNVKLGRSGAAGAF